MRQPMIMFIGEIGGASDLLTLHDVVVNEVHARDAMHVAERTVPDLILLDLTALEAEGDASRVVRGLHSRCPGTPLVVTCSACTSAQRIGKLQSGIDDVLCDPLASAETLEWIRAKLRRATHHRLNPEIFVGRHVFANFTDMEIRVDGTLVTLTRRELGLLSFLIEHRNRVLSRDVILHGVWRRTDLRDPRTVDVHIARLRRKLGTAGSQIETLARYGWRFVESSER